MYKLYLLLIIFVFTLSVVAQDSLKQYSYLVYGFHHGDKSNVYVGTGSFFKKGHRMYFISSNHLFSGFDSEAKRRNDYPDTFYINLKDKKSGKNVKYAVDIRNYKRDNPAVYNFDFPDFLIFRVRHSEKYKINSIEIFMSNDKIIDNDISYVNGYGYFQKSIDNLNKFSGLEPLIFSGTTKGEYEFKMYMNIFLKIDSINYYVYPSKYIDLRGASGSPVFQILKSGKIVFGGIYTASNPEEKIYLIVRPEYIMKHIKDL